MHVAVNCYVKRTKIVLRHCKLESGDLALVAFNVVPSSAEALMVSVVGNAHQVETLHEVGVIHEENALLIRCQGVQIIWNLSTILRSPSYRVFGIPLLKVTDFIPWISEHMHPLDILFVFIAQEKRV